MPKIRIVFLILAVLAFAIPALASNVQVQVPPAAGEVEDSKILNFTQANTEVLAIPVLASNVQVPPAAGEVEDSKIPNFTQANTEVLTSTAIMAIMTSKATAVDNIMGDTVKRVDRI